MAYFAMLWKAQTIEKYRLNYESEKINSILMSKTQIPKQSLSQRWRHYRCDTQKKISTTFKKLYPDGSPLSNFFVYLKTDQTFPNFVIKSFVGFVGGVILTYLCFIFFVFQLSISLIHATIMSSIIGVLLTLGLAFSYRIRCLVFLLIPQCFSRVGRYTLTCYALVLILTGPATNTLKNSEVLSESLACSQEQIKTSVRTLNLMTTKPLNNLKDSIQPMVERLRMIAIKVKDMFLKINRLILSIADVIQTGHLWLHSLSNACNNKLGTPYSKCMQSIQSGMQTCKKEFPSNQSTLCSTDEAMKKICSDMSHDFTCVLVDPVSGNIAPVIRKRLANFSDRLKHMLSMQVHVHHSYSFSSNTTRTASQVAAGIVTEIRKRADPLLTWLSWCSCVTSLFLCLIVFRAKNYQHMFETRSRFDNRYITKEIRILDLKRLREGRETILPLNRRERAKYVTTTSFRLVASEKAFINRSIVFMTITTFKLLIHMVADYSLYWVLMTIRYHGRLQSLIQPGSLSASAHISGSGPTADLLKAIVSSLSGLIESPVLTPVSCLPNPHPPDFRRYFQIGVLIFLLWFVAICEPYGLRLRHVVMGHYQSDRAKARAVWLYNHILRTRGSFMKFARRKLHRVYKYRPEERLTFRKWLDDRIPFCWLRAFLGTRSDEPHCLLCGTIYYKHRSDTQLIRCKSSNCPGMYCTSCFMDIGELCTVCLSPEDYGDISDVSLEKGSSDESDSDDDTIYKRQHNVYNLDNCESGEYAEYAASNESQRYKKCMSSTTKKNTSDLMPLLRRKNIQYTSRSNKESDLIDVPDTITKSFIKITSFLKQRKKDYEYNMSQIRYREQSVIRCDGNGIIHICSKISTGLSGQIRPASKPPNCRTKHERTKKQVQNERKKIKKANVSKATNISLENANSFTIKKVDTDPKSVKSLPSFTQLIERISQHSFYNITFSKSSINVDKIIQKTNLRMSLKKQFYSTRKFKMKRRYRRCSLMNLNSTNMKIVYSCKRNRKNRSKAITSCSYIADYKMDFNIVGNDDDGNKSFKKMVHEKEPTKTEVSSCYNFRKLRMLFSDFWKNVIPNIAAIDTSNSSSAKSDNLVSKESKNHKHRKKKECKNQNFTSEFRNTDVSLDDEENRNYRIFSYLSDQEWMKRQRGRMDVKHMIETECTISDALAYIESVSRKRNKQKRVRANSFKICTKADKIVKRRNANKACTSLKERYLKFYGSTRVSDDFRENVMLKCSLSIVKSLCKGRDRLGDSSFRKSKSVDESKKIKAVEGQQNLCAKEDAETETNITTKEISTQTMKKSKKTLKKIKSGFVNIFKCSKKTSSKSKELSNGHKNKMAQMQNGQNTLVEDVREEIGDSGSRNENTECTGKTCTCATQYDRFVNDKLQKGIYQHTSRSCYGSNSLSSSIRSDAFSCTDATFCSLAYLDNKSRKRKSRKTKVVTKANQMIGTDKPTLCDVSTTTSDWWSPIVEKRKIYKDKKLKIVKEVDEDEKYRVVNRTLRKDGKLVKFRSQAQIIPEGEENMMSPERYLLESQKYYNELFSSRYYAPHVFPINLVQRIKRCSTSSTNDNVSLNVCCNSMSSLT